MTKPARKPLPAKALDAGKRAEVLALVRLGCTRRMAADKVRCAHTTIGRAAARDPAFAAALAAAESRPDRGFRGLIRTTDRRKRRADDDRRAEELLPLRGFRSLEVVEMLLALFVHARPPVRRKDVIDFIRRLHAIVVREEGDAPQSCPNCQKHARLFDALKQLSDNTLRQQMPCAHPCTNARRGASRGNHAPKPAVPKSFLSCF